MLFKALNNKEEEKTEHSYIYSHTTKHLNFTVKSKRSQSALEYMMTYGWAILIIVIVAVILYSMGIFNPSSSVTFTSSGFSPFTVSSSLCNNLGYKIAIIAGPIPNNANYITINKVFVTSATGANATTASYALTNPVTLKSGQSTTILIPNVACNSANIHYSLSAKIQYSYTASTLGLQTINTTGTVAGTSITGKPSVLTTYEPITITNTQSSATPNPFQQMVNFTSADPGFSSIATGNFGQNVEFFYYNGTIIPSWLENYTSTNALWWLKIAAIPAGSSETVYVGFAPTLTNLFNTVNDGEAPQIPCGSTPTSSCSNYAEYDDGANVFNFYNNFAGDNLNKVWITQNVNYHILNGLNVTETPSNPGWIYANFKITTNNLIGFYGEFGGYYNVGTSYQQSFAGIFFQCTSGTCHGQEQWPGKSVATAAVQSATNSYYFIEVKNSTSSSYFQNHNYIGLLTIGDLIFPLNLTAFITNGAVTANFYMNYIFSSTSLINGVMPSVSFDSVA